MVISHTFLSHFSYYYCPSSTIFFFVYTLCAPLPVISIPESGSRPHCLSSLVAAV